MNNNNPYKSTSVVLCQEYLQQTNIKYSLAIFGLYSTVFRSYNTKVLFGVPPRSSNYFRCTPTIVDLQSSSFQKD